MLLKPNKKTFKFFTKIFSDIVKNNCVYPNETLFWYTNLVTGHKVYNLPIKYNYVKYNKNSFSNIYVYHFNSSTYKHLDIIRDGYLEIYRKKNKQIYDALVLFKKEYYDTNHEKIEQILEKVR